MATNSSAAAHQRIPALYRIFFTWLDPAIALWGAYLNFFMPARVLDAYIPAALTPFNADEFMLYRILGADVLMIGFCSIVLLRYTADVGVWRIYQAGILLIDAVILYTLWEALGRQGRRSVDGMRGEDWACIVLTGAVAIIRSLFLVGVGFKRSGNASKRA